MPKKNKKQNPNGWNYRIVCQFCVDLGNGVSMASYGVHEVYYTDNKPDSMTTDEVSPGGSNELDFWKSTFLYTRAFSQDILYFDIDRDQFVKEKPEWPI